MAVANNFKPVTDGASYQPSTVDEFNSMIGKVGKQMIREITASNPLNVFNKGYMEKGDTLEIVVTKLVEASAYDRTGSNALARNTVEKLLARYNNAWLRRVFETTVDIPEIRQVLVSGSDTSDIATKIVSELGESRTDDKYQRLKALFKWGTTNGSLDATHAAFVNAGDVKKLTDGALDYKGILKKIKDTVSGMKYANTNFNAVGVKRRTYADDIYIVMPYTIKNAIDVDELAGVFNLSKTELAGRIIEIDSEDTYIYIVDRNAIIDITRIDEMMSQKNAKGLFVNYFYHVEDMMTICPLFDACYFNYAAATA